MAFIHRVTRGPLWVVALLVALVCVAAAPVSAAEPSGYGYFHTYAEMSDVIDDAVADHPNLAAKFSIGRSYQGRAIRAIRITANVSAGNQGKPEIFINGMIHGRERASGELAIHMIEVLTNNYGQGTTLGQRVTSILQSTVVYIVPMVNPDGAEFDFQGGTFHKWRKNRQPIPGSSATGVDLNRQFGYTWNCCPGGSSGNPSSDFYRGPEAWFAPEVRAYRNFVNDRAHRLKGILSLHSAGRQVLWPYAYTRQDVPSDMSAADHRAMVALGRGMAQRNGYTAEQGSDLYIVAGDQDDWAYGVHGIYAFTIEMAKGSAKRYYPSRSELNRDLDRNRQAILWFLEQADADASQSLVRSPATSAAGQGSTVSSEVFAEAAAATTQKFKHSVFNANAVQPQKTNCWCVVASTRAWLRHMDPAFSVKQSDLNAYMTTKDKNDWTDPGTSYYIRCTGGSPKPSFAHDGRGMAWTLWQNRPAGTDHGFQDYMTTTAKAMNWQFVRNVRATGDPVGADRCRRQARDPRRWLQHQARSVQRERTDQQPVRLPSLGSVVPGRLRQLVGLASRRLRGQFLRDHRGLESEILQARSERGSVLLQPVRRRASDGERRAAERQPGPKLRSAGLRDGQRRRADRPARGDRRLIHRMPRHLRLRRRSPMPSRSGCEPMGC